MKYRLSLSAFFLFLGVSSAALAEYRVFVLKIYKAETPQEFRLVESTLDHVQYRQYYHVAAGEVVTYIDTWRCYGRTGDFKELCPNPKGQIPLAEAPAP